MNCITLVPEPGKKEAGTGNILQPLTPGRRIFTSPYGWRYRLL